MEKLLNDDVPFVLGMDIWTGSNVRDLSDDSYLFLDRAYVSEPCVKQTKEGVNCIWQNSIKFKNDTYITSQWVLSFNDSEMYTSLRYFYSTKENAILYPLLSTFPLCYLMKCYRTDYLISEFKKLSERFSVNLDFVELLNQNKGYYVWKKNTTFQ